MEQTTYGTRIKVCRYRKETYMYRYCTRERGGEGEREREREKI